MRRQEGRVYGPRFRFGSFLKTCELQIVLSHLPQERKRIYAVLHAWPLALPALGPRD